MSHTPLDAAAVLLVQIAGPEPVHIEMSARGPKKYYDVHRVFTQQDARAHLLGRTTRGATLRHPGDMTRALCYDADTPDDWLFLLEAAWRLVEQGYQLLLEESPVARGGHHPHSLGRYWRVTKAAGLPFRITTGRPRPAPGPAGFRSGFKVVPVRPGRNLTTIVEVAARNHLLKLQGHHSAKDFQEKLSREIAQATVTRGIGDEVE